MNIPDLKPRQKLKLEGYWEACKSARLHDYLSADLHILFGDMNPVKTWELLSLLSKERAKNVIGQGCLDNLRIKLWSFTLKLKMSVI